MAFRVLLICFAVGDLAKGFGNIKLSRFRQGTLQHHRKPLSGTREGKMMDDCHQDEDTVHACIYIYVCVCM